MKAQVREGMEELQMEEEIVFVGWEEKQNDVTMADLAVPKELDEVEEKQMSDEKSSAHDAQEQPPVEMLFSQADVRPGQAPAPKMLEIPSPEQLIEERSPIQAAIEAVELPPAVIQTADIEMVAEASPVAAVELPACVSGEIEVHVEADAAAIEPEPAVYNRIELVQEIYEEGAIIDAESAVYGEVEISLKGSSLAEYTVESPVAETSPALVTASQNVSPQLLAQEPSPLDLPAASPVLSTVEVTALPLNEAVMTPEAAEVREQPSFSRCLASTVIQFNMPAEPKPVEEAAEEEPEEEQTPTAGKPIKRTYRKRAKENAQEIAKRTRGMKRRRVDDEVDARRDEEEEAALQAHAKKAKFGLIVEEKKAGPVGSDVRYEVVKKGDQNVLMAKRCSRRHAGNEAAEPTDQTAVEEAFYQSRTIELEDIKEVIGKLGGNELALI